MRPFRQTGRDGDQTQSGPLDTGEWYIYYTTAAPIWHDEFSDPEVQEIAIISKKYLGILCLS